MDKRKVYWIGVSFDPNEDQSEYIEGQHEAIVNSYCDDLLKDAEVRQELLIDENGFEVGTLDRRTTPGFGGTMMDIWDQWDSRIGFGLDVGDIEAHAATWPVIVENVRETFRKIGVTMYVSAYEWDPYVIPSGLPRPAGVDEMLSLDIC